MLRLGFITMMAGMLGTLQGPRQALPDPVSGPWSLMFFVAGHPTPATMELKLEGSAVTGTIHSEHTGAGTLTEGRWVRDTLSFVAVFPQHESIALTATLKDGKLVGEFRTEGFTAKWEATRRSP